MLKTASSVINALGALVYQGTWDANANNPTLTSSVGTKGNYYVVSVAGTTNLNGISTWSVGDWAVFNGSVWQKVDGGTSESFVNLTVTGTANIATGNVVNMTSSNVTITGGSVNGATIGATTPSTGSFTTLTANSTVSFTSPVTVSASTYSVGASDLWLIFNYSSGTCTVTLPTASSYTGRILRLQNYQNQTVVSASSNVIQMGGGSATTALLNAISGDACTLVSNGTNWVMMEYVPNNILLI